MGVILTIFHFVLSAPIKKKVAFKAETSGDIGATIAVRS